jgi:hypothetical protein
VDCGAGKYSTTTGASVASTCLDCGAGKSSTTPGATLTITCIVCSVNTYSVVVGATSSSSCMDYAASSTSLAGSPGSDYCHCAAGTAAPITASFGGPYYVCQWSIYGGYNAATWTNSNGRFLTYGVGGMWTIWSSNWSWRARIANAATSGIHDLHNNSNWGLGADCGAGVCVYYCRTYYKAVCAGEGDSEGHVLVVSFGQYLKMYFNAHHVFRAGKYAPRGSNSCQSCDAGKYSMTTGASIVSTCTDCGVGKYATATGASTCTDYGAGTYSTATGASVASTCVDCRAGKYSNATGASSSGTCADCSAGTFSAEVGATGMATCASCVAGKSPSNSVLPSRGFWLAYPLRCRGY